MPAHRSDAEADIRIPAIARLREILPGCRIIHEINAGTWGPNRIDLLAVSETRILAAEIKSAKDKLTRLPAQIASMNRVAHGSVAVIHEKFLVEIGHLGYIVPPDEARDTTCWVWPRKERGKHAYCGPDWHPANRWKKPKLMPPPDALALLWREELFQACADHGIKATQKHRIEDMEDAIKWALTGEQITRLICRALRRRECTEADPPIFETVGETATRFTRRPVRATAKAG